MPFKHTFGQVFPTFPPVEEAKVSIVLLIDIGKSTLCNRIP
jgi:hypothetical protein